MKKLFLLSFSFILLSISLNARDNLDKGLASFIAKCNNDTANISESRKNDLQLLAKNIYEKSSSSKSFLINFIDDNNAHLSVIYQNMGKAIVIFTKNFKIDFNSYGISTSEYNKYAMKSMSNAGFYIYKMSESVNSEHEFRYNLFSSVRTVKSIKISDKILSKSNSYNIFLTSKSYESSGLNKDNTFLLNSDDSFNLLNNSKKQDDFDLETKRITTEILYLFKLLSEM